MREKAPPLGGLISATPRIFISCKVKVLQMLKYLFRPDLGVEATRVEVNIAIRNGQ